MALTLIIGPMKSGKTLELIARLNPYEHTDLTTLLIQSARNVRDFKIESRSGLKKEAQKVKGLHEVADTTADIIGIDEIHMFAVEDISVIEQWLLANKQVMVSGLDIDYSATLIPVIKAILELKPETIIDRAAVCELCKRYEARFTQIVHNDSVVRSGLPPVVPEDGSYEYRPVCRACYFKD